jgi:hypothetical protein
MLALVVTPRLLAGTRLEQPAGQPQQLTRIPGS